MKNQENTQTSPNLFCPIGALLEPYRRNHGLLTGPLTQATGPLWSDAGVGIGMLRGNPVLSAI